MYKLSNLHKFFSSVFVCVFDVNVDLELQELMDVVAKVLVVVMNAAYVVVVCIVCISVFISNVCIIVIVSIFLLVLLFVLFWLLLFFVVRIYVVAGFVSMLL